MNSIYFMCVCVPLSLCVYEWVIPQWPHPTWAVDLAGREYLASVSLPVPDSTAHITGLFVPNVTPLKGREGIPSLPLALFPCFFLCAAMTEPNPRNTTYGCLSLWGNTQVVKLELLKSFFFWFISNKATSGLALGELWNQMHHLCLPEKKCLLRFTKSRIVQSESTGGPLFLFILLMFHPVRVS